MQERGDIIGLEVTILLGAEAQAKPTATTYATTRWVMICTIAVGVFLAGLIATIITRLISRPVTKAGEVLDMLAAADFSTRLDVSSEDELGRMARAINSTSESLGPALEETGTVMAAAAAGDLTRRITFETKGDVRKMSDALNSVLDKMA